MITQRLAALAVCALLTLAAAARAADAPATAPAAVTLKGTLSCGKCTLSETPECLNVLTVKTGDKSENYYLTDNDCSKAAHGDICMAPKEGYTATGTVSEKDGKKWLTPTKIEAPK